MTHDDEQKEELTPKQIIEHLHLVQITDGASCRQIAREIGIDGTFISGLLCRKMKMGERTRQRLQAWIRGEPMPIFTRKGETFQYVGKPGKMEFLPYDFARFDYPPNFGYWTILARAEAAGWYLCRCKCGKTKQLHANTILSGKSKSCRCHGRGAYLKEVRAWTLLKYRCNTSTSPDYSKYGGRGIKVCERWLDFDSFLADMGPMPFDGATVERVDVNGNYEPSNCCWMDRFEQAKNRRNTKWVIFQGKKIQLQEAIRMSNLNRSTVENRLKRGWSLEDALTISPKPPIKKCSDSA